MAEPEMPSGRITLRTSPEIHAQLAAVAEAMGLDMTALLNLMLAESLPKYTARAARLKWLSLRAAEILASGPAQLDDKEFLEELDPDVEEVADEAEAKRLIEKVERAQAEWSEHANRSRAASLVRRGGKSTEAVAAELGVDVATIKRWVAEVEAEEWGKLRERARVLSAAGKTISEIARTLRVDEATVQEFLEDQQEKQRGKKPSRKR